MTGSTPERVIAELLDAFDGPTAAAAALYPLLAPRMRASVGAQADLARTLGNTLFAPLVRGEVAVAEVEVRDAAARVRVTADDSGGRAPYLFSLAREGADRSGPWRITGLVREDAV